MGEEWKNLRSTFTPIFTSGKMKAMLVFMNETSNRLMTALSETKGSEFELKEMLGKFSMDTIASCAFGVDSQAFTSKDSRFVQYASALFARTFMDGVKIGLAMIPPIRKILSVLKISVMKVTETEFFYDAVMASLKHRRESKTRRNDLVDLMMDAIKGDIEHEEEGHEEQFEKDAKLDHVHKKGEFDELTIVATAIVFLVAGYDTTASTLAFVCYELSKDSDIQEKLRREVRQVSADPDKGFSYDDLGQMTYMDQVISEALRLYNPAVILQRAAKEDYKVPGHDLVIPKGTGVWINPLGIHFNPKHYSNPHKFDPEHFSKEAKASRSP